MSTLRLIQKIYKDFRASITSEYARKILDIIFTPIPENKLIKEKAESKAESYISGLVEDIKNEQSKDDESKDE